MDALDLNYAAPLIAAAATFLFAAVYYSVLGSAMERFGSAATTTERPPVMTVAFELGKGVVLAVAIGVAVRQLGIADAAGALSLAVASWIAFPVLILASSVMHEGVRPLRAGHHPRDGRAQHAIVSRLGARWG